MWTAFILGALVVVGFTGYAAWAVYMVSQGSPLWPFVVGAPFAYLAVPFVFTCIWMALAWWMRATCPAEFRLAPLQASRLFGNEFAALAQSVPKMILYRLLMPEPPAVHASAPILLVHGVGCNAGIWSGLRRHLEAQNLGPVYALSYGPPLASIEQFAGQLATRIAEILTTTGATRVLIIGHSMGGLVARAYLNQAGGTHVRKLITLGTPHAGSRHAWLMMGPPLVEMRPGSAFLAALDAGAAAVPSVPVVSLWSWNDSMVTPQTSSRLAWARNIEIGGVAHNAMLTDRDVWRRLVAEIVDSTTVTRQP